ncbi:MAG: biotin--[acetyl-CoA-carboxylase] ligase [Myxococcales bacterium]|nr:biotin--[acetyl-CoA-carboxylase] ligase [Myxococcales bacterium]
MSAADLALPERPHLRVLESVGSTNAEALAWAAAGAPHLAAIVADTQTAGRGRLERRWHSPPGRNLYLSLILRGTPEALRRTPWVGAVAVRACVARALSRPVLIKWPNDILVDERKVCGILAEALLAPAPAAVLGIGLNVNMEAHEFPPGLRQPASSLKLISGRAFARGPLLAEVLDEVAAAAERAARSPQYLMDEARRNCHTLGRRVEIAMAGRTLTGTATDLDDDGALILRDDAGHQHTISAGDVTLAR